MSASDHDPHSEPPPAPPIKREKTFPIRRVATAEVTAHDDNIVIEEPMEIRLVFGPNGNRTMRSLAVTMRTPGHDKELAAGFLKTEGILFSADQIDSFKIFGTDGDGHPTGNIVRVNLSPYLKLDFGKLQRHFFTSSSCGVCGKASLKSLELHGLQPFHNDEGVLVGKKTVHHMPTMLRDKQPTFARTGGLHAAAICNEDGQPLHVREDVGRHNAVDKLVGRFFLDEETPLTNYAMIISGRASFEIMQKALVAGVAMVIAVGAPSSLAIDIAKQYNMTLVGFASDTRFNIYAGAHRITSD